MQPFVSLTFAGQNLVLGTASGDLYRMHHSGRKLVGVERGAHAGHVTVLEPHPYGGIISGGADGIVRTWSDTVSRYFGW